MYANRIPYRVPDLTDLSELFLERDMNCRSTIRVRARENDTDRQTYLLFKSQNVIEIESQMEAQEGGICCKSVLRSVGSTTIILF